MKSNPVLLISMLLAFLSATISTALGAEALKTHPVAFSELWKKIRAKSPTITAMEHELEAATIARGRQAGHWLPRIYAGGRVYRTNDPGANLFGILEQRELLATDFNPVTLNHPDARTYRALTFGAELPVFEGGSRVFATRATTKMVEAKSSDADYTRLRLYVESAKLYGQAAILRDAALDLRSLNELVEGVLERYKLGAQANPVGYSGLLGLKGLNNRIDGMLAENQARHQATRIGLEEMAATLPADWDVESTPPVDFAKQVLEGESRSEGSLRVKGLSQMAAATEEVAKAERARFLPRIGLFSEYSINGGERGSAGSYVGGAYLQWQLFAADNFGAVDQARAQSAALDSHADELRQHEQIENAGSEKALKALETNISLMKNSSSLLDEQTRMARKLFTSGALSALQLSEVFNRRADLIANLVEAQTQYLNTRATLFINKGEITP